MSRLIGTENDLVVLSKEESRQIRALSNNSLSVNTSTGVLRYSYAEDYGYKLVLNIDQQISEYYRSLLPKWIKSNRQLYPAHVSIVRKEVPTNLGYWGRYEGEEVEFSYTHEIFFSEVYCWLNVFCNRLELIRMELGLPISSPFTRPPAGFLKCFHTTIANFKGI